MTHRRTSRTALERSSTGDRPARRERAAWTAGGFRRALLALGMLGFLGVLAILPTAIRLLRQLVADPAQAAPPLPVLVGLSVLQSSVLTLASVAVGLALAHRVGLRSLIAERFGMGLATWSRFLRDARLALPIGLAMGALLWTVDALLAPHLGEAWQRLMDAEPRTVGLTLTGMAYGGIVEELLLRWGLMTFLVWLGWRLARRRSVSPSIVWTAILVTAVAFAVLHLPALSLSIPVTLALGVRTIFLNTFAGVIYGVLFWRRSLEAAMLAHAATHVGMSLLAWAGVG